jgi:glycosyltransferase involved in cell wall biosynthesis
MAAQSLGADVASGVSPGTSVGVVIRTLNESEFIGRCLETLQRQRGGFDLDVLVVDSGSTDSTIEIAQAHGARVFNLAPGDFDYSTALNVGIEQTEGDLVVSLSAHAIPLDDEWLERMTAPFRDGNVAGTASRQVPWPNAHWQEVKRLSEQFGEAGRVYSQANADEVFFSNAASAIRRSVWRDAPFTLPAVEDLEWARRVVAAGWAIVYEPSAVVYHSHREVPRAQARRLIDINRVLDAEARPRTLRRTLREAIGLLIRDSRKIVTLDEPLRRKLTHVVDLTRVAFYYAADFSQSGTTAERRREETRSAADRAADGPASKP